MTLEDKLRTKKICDVAMIEMGIKGDEQVEKNNTYNLGAAEVIAYGTAVKFINKQ